MPRWLTLSLVAIVAIAAVTYLVVEPPLPFVRSVWSAREHVSGDDLHVRGRMAEGLINDRRLIGLSRDQVVGLLGPPPTTDKFQNWGLVYWLCWDRSFLGVDSEWLVMNFDDAGRVTEARLVTD